MQSSSLLHNGIQKKDDGRLGALYDPMNANAMGVKPYTSTVALAMTLNYIIGTGCFGLPYAFTESGLILTALFLVCGALVAMISMNYTLEALARAEGITTAQSLAAPNPPAPDHHMTYRKFDFCTIAYIFAGQRGKDVVQVIITLYCVGTLWSYASVFASSMSSMFYTYAYSGACDVFHDPSTGCLNAYYISMAVFAVVVITLVLMDLGDQAGIQNVLSICRIIALVLMLITMCVKIGFEPSQVVERASKIGSFDFRNFGKGFGPSILAINCHYNMPDALQPLKQKKDAKFVTFFALGISAVFYLALGLLGAVAFDEVNPLVTLNWTEYSGCGNGWAHCDSTPLKIVGSIVRFFILFFPVINVSSAYPMVGLTMAENIFMSVPQKIKSRFGVSASRSTCRLIAAIPPLILASAFKKLDFILTIAGLFGFILGLSIPCWFQIRGLRICEQMWGTIAAGITDFTVDRLSSIPAAYFFYVLSFFITTLAIATLFI